ncbi:MAG: hypothetical protein ICV60_21105 [Pyrinomonadaceae bacterium]|nr:hypothetical protein [Pyrinomonadaceae bacterium]
MRLARRALFAALAMLVLSAVASAQTLRSENDPRNLSPSVGTGGPEGGPTGLFTIYDGQTLRRGEFTFSVAYSNFDRDPGNLDIVETPLSFNIGLSDYIELFFKTTGYKGIKANSPLNLSGFYLPNSRVFFGNNLLGSPPAIILAPSGPNVGTINGTAVFRPAFCPACTTATSGSTFAYFNGGQPFVQYPFTGGPGPTFGLSAGTTPPGFAGFPGFNATLGPPRATANNGTFGSAAAFPGVGSPLGSILPGIVLATSLLPNTIIGGPINVPATFTIAPSYYPGAPFLNRLYGESSFTDGVVGAKIRFTEPDNPLGVGIIPFYRYWWDKGDDVSGFNQMQRGAGPGGDIGDFGLVGFIDGRLSRSVNVSVNGGWIVNSNPKDPNGFVLLDRPDEFIAGIGFDFPINKWFQPIFELRSTQYVGGRTPNAFENSPVEFTAGTKIYPRRWWGIGLWYRRHINQQRQNLFAGAGNINTAVRQVTNVNVNGTILVVPATTVPATVNEFPRGFRFSDDANGFGFQFFIGRRNARSPEYLPNQAPTVTLSASSTSIILPCPPGQRAECQPGPSGSQQVQLTANATDPDGDTLLYSYNVSGGRITGEGPNVTWDLTGVTPGTYTANVEVDDGCGCISFSSVSVTVAECNRCVLPCPTVTVTCPDTVAEGESITFTANVTGGDPNVSPTYNWSVSSGTISSGQGTPTITVTGATGGASVTATVNVGGYPPECNTTASCTTTITISQRARLFDQYGNIAFNDEKARLDNFAIQLQNEPGSQGYIIAYAGRRARANEAQARADRAKDYLVNTRGIDPGRLVTVDGGFREDLTVELWIVPSGAAPPTASPTLQQSDVTIITGGTGRTGGRRRRR